MPVSARETDERKARRRDEVKQRLQQALRLEVRDQPFREVKIEQIAEAADLSRSAFYFYYRDKSDLLMDATTGTVEMLYAEADRWWHGDGEPASMIRESLGGVVSVWEQNADVLRVVTEVSTYDEEIRKFWRGLVLTFIDATADFIRREQAAGRAPADVDPSPVAELLVWQLERSLYIYVSTGDRPAAEIVEPVASLWLRAIYAAEPG